MVVEVEDLKFAAECGVERFLLVKKDGHWHQQYCYHKDRGFCGLWCPLCTEVRNIYKAGLGKSQADLGVVLCQDRILKIANKNSSSIQTHNVKD